MRNLIQKYSLSYLNDLLEIVQSLDGEKSALQDRKILITGGTGFLGRWLVDSLLLMGVQVTVFTRNRSKALNLSPYWDQCPQLNWMEGETLERAKLVSSDGNSLTELNSSAFNEVIHAASDLSLSPEATLQLATSVFDFAERTGAKRVLFLSSGAVNAGSIHPYAAGKILVEKEGVKRAEQGKFEFKIARCFSFLGPHQNLDSHFAATQFFKSVLDTQPITLQGDGSDLRSYLYPTDFVTGVLQILLHGKSSLPYELGSDEAINILGLANRINALRSGPPLEVNVLKQNTNSLSQSSTYLPNLTLMKSEFQFQPKIKVDEAIKRTADFYAEVFPNSSIRR